MIQYIVCVLKFERIHEYCMYMTVSMRLTTFRTENTLKYVYTCKYVQYTSLIHTMYDIDTYI